MSKRSAGKFERRPRDLYDTPRAAVAPLLPYLSAGTEFAEPCAGRGWLIDALVDQGHHCVWATDLSPGREDIGRMNALALAHIGRRNVRAQVVITNLPWTRRMMHPLIDSLSAVWPCWFLFDSDWAYTAQSSETGLINRCSRIVPIGRVKWMPGTKNVGFDNACWYEFLPGHTEGPHLLPWRRVSKHLRMMGPEERRHAEIVASGHVADPGPLFEALEGNPHAEKTAVPLVPSDNREAPEGQIGSASQIAADAGSLSDPGIAGRPRNGAVVPPVQHGQGEHGCGPVGRVSASASEMVARLRSRLRPMVLPRLSPGAFDEQ